MSDIGLQGSIYEQLRSYADRLDHALIQLRSEEPKAAKSGREHAAQLLRELTDKDTLNPTARLVSLILKQELPSQTGRGLDLCDALAQTLEQRLPDSTEFRHLEQIAMTLDIECTTTLARIHGRT